MSDITTDPNPIKMSQQQAINILAQAVQLAQQRGAYSFKESGMIGYALDAFSPSETSTTSTNSTSSKSIITNPNID